MRWMCWILAGAVLSMPVAAEVCDTEAVLKAHLEAAKVAEETYVLAYDHDRGDGWWQGYWSKCDPAGTCKLYSLGDEDQFKDALKAGLSPRTVLEIRPEGNPRLTAPRDSKARAFVVGTNPYAYTVTAGDGKEVDHEDLAELKTLALLVGGTARSALSVAGTEYATLVAAGAAGVGTKPSAEQSAILGQMGILPSYVWAPPEPRPLQLVYRELSVEIERSRQSSTGALKRVESTADDLRDSIDGLEAAERYVRAVETRDTAGMEKSFSPPSETAFSDDFAKLREAHADLEREKATCPKELGWLSRAAELRLEPLPTVHHPRERRAHLSELDELVAKLGSGDVCTALRPALNRAASWFGAYPPIGARLSSEDVAVLIAINKLIRGYLSVFEKLVEPLAASKKLLEKGTGLGQRASLVAHVLTRKPGYVSGANCHLTHGVLPVARAEGAKVSVPWNKVRTETFTIAFDDNLKGIVTPTRAKREEKYELQVASPWRNFDIDLGLVHSNLRQHTYSAVAATTVPGGEGESGGASEEGDGEESSPPLQIARTQSEKLSGDVAMFVSWLPPKLDRGSLSAGPQIGVGLDSDHPAAFAGFVVSIGRYLNLSGGWSWQEVEDLVPGQDVGTVVTSNDDIRTRKEFENGWYASLAITLNDLPFFGGGKE